MKRNYRKLAGPPKPPPDAHHWIAYKVDRVGKKKFKVRGEPLADGTVPDSWPVEEFSTARILDLWGPSVYVTMWFNAAGEQLGTSTFEVAQASTPDPAGPKLKRPRGRPPSAPRNLAAPLADDEDDDEPAPVRRQTGESMSLGDYLVLQQQNADRQEKREERIAARLREDAERNQQRDREFMGQILATLRQPTGAPDADLLRREMALTIREGLSQIRSELAPLGGADDDDEEETPPADLEEAGQRVGMRLLQELEQKTPDLLRDAIPRISEWLQAQGFRPSPELAAQIAAATPSPNGVRKP
jgi:hypothetical protein